MFRGKKYKDNAKLIDRGIRTDATPKYNASVCEQLGITPLDGYEAIDG